MDAVAPRRLKVDLLKKNEVGPSLANDFSDLTQPLQDFTTRSGIVSPSLGASPVSKRNIPG